MKTFVGVQVFLLVLYIFGTNGRHTGQNDDEDLSEGEHTDLLNQMNDHMSQTRHRRRSRQMYGYDYQPPYSYDYRRDYGVRQQEEYLSRIVKSLDEIISYIRRPPLPPPQPVYIPYPVFQNIPCRSQPRPIPAPAMNESTTQIPDVTIRFPVIEDENQLWGIPIEDIPEEEDNDGSRPISFVPIEPNRPTRRPPPPVEHGSNQAGSPTMTMTTTTPAPFRRPGTCETAILTCCSIQGRTAQRNCFTRYDCSKTYATNRACDPAVIKRVLEHFTNAYAPVKNNQ